MLWHCSYTHNSVFLDDLRHKGIHSRWSRVAPLFFLSWNATICRPDIGPPSFFFFVVKKVKGQSRSKIHRRSFHRKMCVPFGNKEPQKKISFSMFKKETISFYDDALDECVGILVVSKVRKRNFFLSHFYWPKSNIYAYMNTQKEMTMIERAYMVKRPWKSENSRPDLSSSSRLHSSTAES